jgi:FG-GAP-like repeat
MKKLITFLLLIITMSKGKSQSTDFSNCPTCRTSDIEVLNEINTKYLGVKGYNPSRPSTYNLVGDNKFAGFTGHEVYGVFLNNNWYPIRKEKQILCGTVKSFGVANFGDESDWNTVLLPDAGFESFIADALEFRMFNWYSHIPFDFLETKSDWYETTDGKYMIEAEITPRISEFNNPWFTNVDEKTQLLNKKIGVYGPFVGEESHGRRPEIHPSEQIWWKEGDNKTMILLVCDASNRFDEDSDYDDRYADDNWHPWTQDKGQEAELSIPFEIEIGKGTLYYSLQALETPNFYGAANYPDASTGTRHSITYKGQSVLTVEESINFDKYTGITFKDVCYKNDTLRGLIVIKTAIGNGGGGKEGFAALQIEKAKLGLNDKQGLVAGNIIGTANNWTTYNKDYDSDILFGSTIISSDKRGEGIVDGLIDFNGNGITDLFTSANGKWMVMYDAKGKWTEINNSGEKLSELRFGDIDGDKKTDVMYVNSDHRLQVSFGGTGRWKDYSNVEGLNYPTGNYNGVRVGDFNGDGKTDIIKRVDRYEASTNYAQIDIDIKYGCSGEWKRLESGFKVYVGDWEHRIRFGDFNGDGITDMFRYYQDKFQVYYGGRGNLTLLCKPLISDINVANDLLFVNSLSKKGFTDIIYVKKSNNAWKIYYEGKTTASGRILKYNDVDNICFGNFKPNELWEPIAMDFIKQPANPQEVSMNVAAKVKRDPFVLYNYKKGSLKSIIINNKSSLSFDMDAVYYNGNSLATKTKNNFKAVTSAKMKSGLNQLGFKQVEEVIDNKEIIGRIENVPLSSASDNEIEIKYTSEAKLSTIETPAYGIGALKGKIEETINGIGDFKNWGSFITDATNPSVSDILLNTTNNTKLIKNITWELIPFYSGIEDKKVNIMEMPHVIKELNAIAYGKDIVKRKEIFGSENVFDIEWQFELTDLTTGQIIPIANLNSLISSGKWANNKIMYTFPETNNLLELKAIAIVKDNLGNKMPNKETFTFYNQHILLPKTDLKLWIDKTASTNKGVSEKLKNIENNKKSEIIFTPIEMKMLLKKQN